MAKKRIAFVLNVMAVGGTEIAFLNMLKIFDYENYEVTVWLKDDSGPLQKELPHNVHIRFWGQKVDEKKALLIDIKRLNINQIFQGIYYRIMSRIYADNWLLSMFYGHMCLPKFEEEYDCVIDFQIDPPDILATAIKRLKANKKVLWVHLKVNRTDSELYLWEKEYLKFDKIICVSEQCKDFFQQSFPKTERLCEVIHNQLNVEEIKLKANEIVDDFEQNNYSIVTVGRLSPEKGQTMIPEIARKLLDLGYNFKWYIIGSGKTENIIKENIDIFQVEKEVVLLGEKKNPFPYMKACDLYVQTSLAEGYCLTTAEARVLNKVIVTTNLPVMHEQFIHGKTGWISRGTNVQEIFEAIKYVLENPEISCKFVYNLQQYNWKKHNELQKLYDFIEE